MAKWIMVAVLCLLLGAFLGNSLTRMTARRHQHTRSVMGLAQFHIDRLDAAAQSGDCANFNRQREYLLAVYGELLQAFPLAYAQDTEFHKRADALRDALQPAQAAGTCSTAVADVKKIGDACEDCHREYR
ncbi:MAG TPA: hypothetical protein VGH84_00815 [Steroidobacteraceae bacterium]|jgi:cytochrome c556